MTLKSFLLAPMNRVSWKSIVRVNPIFRKVYVSIRSYKRVSLGILAMAKEINYWKDNWIQANKSLQQINQGPLNISENHLSVAYQSK